MRHRMPLRLWLIVACSAVFLPLGGLLWYISRAADVRIVEIHPASVTRNDGGILLDFGETWFGNIVLKPTPENRGNEVVVRLGERVDPENHIDLTPLGSVRSYEEKIVLGNSDVTLALTPADKKGLPQDKPAMPFRYVWISGWKGDLTPDALRATVYISTHFSKRGNIHFDGKESQAADLNRLVAFGVHTVAATSFMDLFVDGDRERLPYQADAYIGQMSWYSVTGDVQVLRKTLAELLQKPTWPTEWMSQLIFLVHEDYMMTGDVGYLRSLYRRLKIFALLDFIDDTGLVSTANKSLTLKFAKETGANYLEDIVDWPPGERDGYEMVAHNTVVNAFAYQALRYMAELAGALHLTDDAEKYDRAANSLQAAMERLLVDPAKHVFFDGLESRHTASHALFIPLAFGLVPASRKVATLTALKERIAAYGGGFPCSVYGAQFLLDALFENGEGKTAFGLMRNRTDRGWFNMLDKYDATITHEAWDPKYKENEDWNHIWGSAFLNVIQRRVIGVRVLKPGWATWTVRPADNLTAPVKATIPAGGETISLDIDPLARHVTISGGAAVDHFVKTRATDEAWSYNVVKVPR
jgi:hypothetical protein